MTKQLEKSFMKRAPSFLWQNDYVGEYYMNQYTLQVFIMPCLCSWQEHFGRLYPMIEYMSYRLDRLDPISR